MCYYSQTYSEYVCEPESTVNLTEFVNPLLLSITMIYLFASEEKLKFILESN